MDKRNKEILKTIAWTMIGPILLGLHFSTGYEVFFSIFAFLLILSFIIILPMTLFFVYCEKNNLIKNREVNSAVSPEWVMHVSRGISIASMTVLVLTNHYIIGIIYLINIVCGYVLYYMVRDGFKRVE